MTETTLENNIQNHNTINPNNKYIDINFDMKVKKRNGSVVDFDGLLIKKALTKAFIAVHGPESDQSTVYQSIIKDATDQVIAKLSEQATDLPIDIEKIQNLVEQQLMQHQVPEVAKAYILYRHSQEQKRTKENTDHTITIIGKDGEPVQLSISGIQKEIESVSNELDVDTKKLAADIFANLYEQAPYEDFLKSRIMCARTQIEKNSL